MEDIMENNTCLSLKTVTSLEFISSESLADDIKTKLSKIEPVMGNCSITITFPVQPILKKRIRREMARGVSKEIDNRQNEHFIQCLPKGAIIDMTVPIAPEDPLTSNVIREFIKLLSIGKVRIGENTTLGCGICICCDIRNDTGISIASEYGDVSDFINTYSNQCNSVLIKAHSDTGVLIRNTLSREYPYNLRGDYPYLVDGENNPVIPASTWKGIFRNCIQEWVTNMHDDAAVVDLLFGNRSRDVRGILVFYDSLISNYSVYTENRLHMNKFSGNAFYDGIEKRSYVRGNIKIKIDCLEDITPYKPLIATVLRDFHTKRISVGADMGIGKGFLEIDEINWESK